MDGGYQGRQEKKRAMMRTSEGKITVKVQLQKTLIPAIRENTLCPLLWD